MALGTPSVGRLLDYEQYIEYRIRRTRLRIKGTDVFTACLVLATAGLGVLLVEVVLDHLVGLPLLVRGVALWAGGGLALGFVFEGIVRPLVSPVNGLYAAKTIEDANPALHNGLISYLDLRRHGGVVPRPYLAAIEARVVNDLLGVDVETVVDQRRLIRTTYALSGVVVLFVLYTAVTPRSVLDSVRRALLADVLRPTAVRLRNIKPGDHAALSRVVSGAQVSFSVETEGVRPDRVTLHYRVDGAHEDSTAEFAPGRTAIEPWQTALADVQQSLDYYLAAGDAVSRTYRLEVVPAPGGTSVRADYEFPAYKGLPPKTDVEGGDIEGTRVTLRARTNERGDTPRPPGPGKAAHHDPIPTQVLDPGAGTPETAGEEPGSQNASVTDPGSKDGGRVDAGLNPAAEERPPTLTAEQLEKLHRAFENGHARRTPAESSHSGPPAIPRPSAAQSGDPGPGSSNTLDHPDNASETASKGHAPLADRMPTGPSVTTGGDKRVDARVSAGPAGAAGEISSAGRSGPGASKAPGGRSANAGDPDARSGPDGDRTLSGDGTAGPNQGPPAPRAGTDPAVPRDAGANSAKPVHQAGRPIGPGQEGVPRPPTGQVGRPSADSGSGRPAGAPKGRADNPDPAKGGKEAATGVTWANSRGQEQSPVVKAEPLPKPGREAQPSRSRDESNTRSPNESSNERRRGKEIAKADLRAGEEGRGVAHPDPRRPTTDPSNPRDGQADPTSKAFNPPRAEIARQELSRPEDADNVPPARGENAQGLRRVERPTPEGNVGGKERPRAKAKEESKEPETKENDSQPRETKSLKNAKPPRNLPREWPRPPAEPAHETSPELRQSQPRKAAEPREPEDTGESGTPGLPHPPFPAAGQPGKTPAGLPSGNPGPAGERPSQVPHENSTSPGSNRSKMPHSSPPRESQSPTPHKKSMSPTQVRKSSSRMRREQGQGAGSATEGLGGRGNGPGPLDGSGARGNAGTTGPRGEFGQALTPTPGGQTRSRAEASRSPSGGSPGVGAVSRAEPGTSFGHPGLTESQGAGPSATANWANELPGPQVGPRSGPSLGDGLTRAPQGRATDSRGGRNPRRDDRDTPGPNSGAPPRNDNSKPTPHSATPPENAADTVAPRNQPQSQLAIRRLRDLIATDQVSPEVMDALGLKSREELDQFVAKLEQAPEVAPGPGREIEVRPGSPESLGPGPSRSDVELNATLSPSTRRDRGHVVQDEIRGNNEGLRFVVPPELRAGFNAYRTAVSHSMSQSSHP